jgi:hypothetical protein
MTINPRLVSIVLVATQGLLVAACSMEWEELDRVPSPDHETIAVLAWEHGGGAAGSSVTYLHLIEANGGQDLGDPYLTVTGCAELTPTWRDAVTLEIEYDTPCNIRQITNFWYRDSASTELGFYRIELILVRNPRIDGRAEGPPE